MAKKEHAEPTVTSKTFTVPLQLRHAEFVERLAAQRGETPERVIERCVREAYAKDPYKGGLYNPTGSKPLADSPPTGGVA